jgi:hypothetical protein
MDQEMKGHLQAMEDRMASLIAGAVGGLHTDLKRLEKRLGERLDSIDGRLKLQAGLIQSGPVRWPASPHFRRLPKKDG